MRPLAHAAGRAALDWAVASLVSIGLIAGVHASLVTLEGAGLGSGPAMCVVAAVAGLFGALVIGRWPA